MNKKGFTLIELLAVIIILAILMIIAVPNILSTLATARRQAFVTQAQSLIKAAENKYLLDSMVGSPQRTYNTGELDVSGGNANLTYKVELKKNGTFKKITMVDSSQKLKIVSKNKNNFEVIEASENETAATATAGTTYYAFGDPTSSSPTDYTLVGKNVFIALQGNQKSLCMLMNNTLNCFDNNNFEDEMEHLESIYPSGECEYEWTHEEGGQYIFTCSEKGDVPYNCDFSDNGSVYCNYKQTDDSCSLYGDGTVDCR